MNPAEPWRGLYGFSQYVLDNDPEVRELAAEARRRRAVAERIVGDLAQRSWTDLRTWRSRPVRDYAAAARKLGRALGLDESRLDHVHRFTGGSSTVFPRPLYVIPENAPAGAVASKIHANVAGIASFGGGATANRQAHQRHIEQVASRRDRFEMRDLDL